MKKSNQEEGKNQNPQKKPPLNSYVKYTAIGFQMVAIIGLGTWLGVWLDEKTGTETPWWTIGLALLSVFAALYTTLREHISSK